MRAAEEPGGDGHGSADGQRRSPRVESAARCADALLGSTAAFPRLQPHGDVIKGGVPVSAAHESINK